VDLSNVEKVLELIEWPEDIDTKKGRERFQYAIRSFRNLDFPQKKYVILEVAGGSGIGGIALAKSLMERNCEISELVITDIREKILEKAREFSKRELGFEAKTYVIDAKDLHKLGIKADIVLMYGNSHATFSTLDMIKFLSSASLSLKDDGILLIQGTNMFLAYIINMGYKYVLSERATDDKVLISVHGGYDEIRGMFKRIFIDLISRAKADVEIKFWDFAEILGLCKIFFKEAILEKIESYKGIVICKYPKMIIKPEDID